MGILPRRGALLPIAAMVMLLGSGGGPAAAAGTSPVTLGSGTVTAVGAGPLPSDVTGVSFLVADLDTGDILAAKDARHRLLPASTLKVLTALALIPRVPRDATVTPSFADVNIEGSRVGIIENTPYPAYQLFRAMLMVSGNDAANAIASAAGGQSPTAELMNVEAQRVGALDTHAVNPSGLDAPGQLTTAYDLALIGRAAMQLPDFRTYVATKRSTIKGKDGHPLALSSHDKLLWNYDGAIGIKNGYTIKAGATFIGAATRGGHSLIVTVLHAQARVWPEVAHLMDWGFAAENAGATPIGRLPEPPGQTVRAASNGLANIRAAAAHTSVPGSGPSFATDLTVLAGLVGCAGLVRRRQVRARVRARELRRQPPRPRPVR